MPKTIKKRIRLKKVCFQCGTFNPKMGAKRYKCAVPSSCPGLNWSAKKIQQAITGRMTQRVAAKKKAPKGVGMPVYVIQVWDSGEKHIEGKGFVSKRRAEKYCKKDEFLEFDRIIVDENCD